MDQESEPSDYVQYEHWNVCQRCGRIAPRHTEDWLEGPWVKDERYRVVRCPKHWSEWALRMSGNGRSFDQRLRVYRMRRKYESLPEEPELQLLPLYDEPQRPISELLAEYRDTEVYGDGVRHSLPEIDV